MENILEITLKAMLLVMCIFNCFLVIIFIIKTIVERKEDKKFYEIRNRHLSEMEQFFKNQILAIEKRYIEKNEKEEQTDGERSEK